MRLLPLLLCSSLCLAKLVPSTQPLREGTWMPRELGRFHLAHAGFIEVYDNEAGQKDMYITTFNPALPYFHDPVFRLRSPGDSLDSVASWADSLETLGVSATAYWPNFPCKMPSEVVGFEGIVQTSGFLVPGKNTGKLELYSLSDNKRGPIDIAAGQDKAWSYHWVIWKDIDDDGLLDAFTARFRVPGFLEGGDPISELLWFKNPGGEAPATGHEWAWKEFIMVTGGPDVYFEETLYEVCDPECKEYSAIVTGELWTERIMIYYVENLPGAWGQHGNIKSVVVDPSPGQPFEARFADVNNDGKLEILASAYDTSNGNETGNFFMYQQQDDASWKRTALASGFVANSYLFGGSMAPGKSRLFWPSEEYKNTPTESGAMPKPWIAISGDDDGIHYVMFPKSEDPEDFEYDIQVMVDTQATTAGTMAVVDLDGDGYMEIISAGYTAGEVYVFTFAP